MSVENVGVVVSHNATIIIIIITSNIFKLFRYTLLELAAL